MVSKRNPNAENLQEQNERKLVQPVDLFDKIRMSSGRRVIGQQMLDQEKADRNDAEQRMKLARIIRIAEHELWSLPQKVRFSTALKTKYHCTPMKNKRQLPLNQFALNAIFHVSTIFYAVKAKM
jgi:hypothetical protein